MAIVDEIQIQNIRSFQAISPSLLRHMICAQLFDSLIVCHTLFEGCLGVPLRSTRIQHKDTGTLNIDPLDNLPPDFAIQAF